MGSEGGQQVFCAVRGAETILQKGDVAEVLSREAERDPQQTSQLSDGMAA